MVKEFLMKKLLISLGVFACVTVCAQTVSDSVVMTVAGKQVPLSEFIFIAEKNGEVDLSNTKSVKNYVELFKNFKLKVAEAESLGIDQTSSFKSELDGYRAQLIDSYMSDKEGEKAAARAVYDRGDYSVELTHILFRLPEKTVSKDTVAVYQEAMRVYERLQKGEDMEMVGKTLAEKDKEHVACEYVRCLLPMQTLKVFEDAAYSFDSDQMASIAELLAGCSYRGRSLTEPMRAVMRKIEMSDYLSASEEVMRLKERSV